MDQALVLSESGIDKLLVGAYSMLDGVANNFTFDQWDGAATNWLWGSIRGMEANKGSDKGDQPDMIPIQNFNEQNTNPKVNNRWRILYEGVSRCNAVITTANRAIEEGKLTTEQTGIYVTQARLLRGWYHFEAWRMWKKIPYVTESTNHESLTNDDDVTDEIIADLAVGISLPDDMDQVGRFNGTVARILLAKALMQMKGDYAGALAHLNIAKNGTKPDGSQIGLAPTYGEIFDIANRNGLETVYTVQYSVNDGSGGATGGGGEVLNLPYKGNNGSPGGYYGFFQPTQDFVNSFTTVNGLPVLDATIAATGIHPYNSAVHQNLRDANVTGGDIWSATKKYSKNQGVTVYDPAEPFTDLGYVLSDTTNHVGKNPLTNPANWTLVWTEDNSKTVDPRLDWSVGRRGIPYWDWGVHTGSDWIRKQGYGGPYSNKKQVFKKSELGSFSEVGSWTSGWTSNGYRMIRYADILLMIAECHIETGNLDSARININFVRERAANPAGFVYESNGTTPAAAYDITTYDVAFANADEARIALRMERKLELGMEGHRYFDLNRWGTTVSELTRILTYEKTMAWGNLAYGTAAIGAEDVTYPIPQRQIDLSFGKLEQNR
jgi:hypothetical protein